MKKSTQALELRNVKFYEKLSEETNCYTADLYANGKLVATVRNDGHGGETDVRQFSPKVAKEFAAIEAYCKLLPYKTFGDLSYPVTLDVLADDLFEEWVVKRERSKVVAKLDKLTVNHIVILNREKMAIRDHNIDFVREYLSRLEVPKGAHDRLINYCDHNHSGLAILKLLFSHGVVPTDLTDFVRYQSSFNNEPGAQFTKAALSISLENSKLLLGSNDGIRETLLRRADEYLYFLVSNNLIEKSVSNATIVLQASAGKKRAMERMITLYQFGFPVLELDLGEIFADSVSRLDGAMIIQKYLRSLLIPEADEQVVAGKDGQIQLL